MTLSTLSMFYFYLWLQPIFNALVLHYPFIDIPWRFFFRSCRREAFLPAVWRLCRQAWGLRRLPHQGSRASAETLWPLTEERDLLRGPVWRGQDCCKRKLQTVFIYIGFEALHGEVSMTIVSWWWLEQASRNVETNSRTDSAVVQLIRIL